MTGKKRIRFLAICAAALLATLLFGCADAPVYVISESTASGATLSDTTVLSKTETPVSSETPSLLSTTEPTDPSADTPTVPQTTVEPATTDARVPVTGIAFPDAKITLQVGERIAYEARVLPNDASNKEILYTVGDDTVISYADGYVTGLGAGSAVLIAYSADGGFTARCYVNVSGRDDPTTTPAEPTTTPAEPTTTPVEPTTTPVEPTTTPVEPTTTPVEPTTTPVEPTTAPVEPTGTPGEKQLVSSFSLLSAGDNLYHSSLLKDARSRRRDGVDEDFYFDSIYEAIIPAVTAADYAVINQESMILSKSTWRKLGKTTVEEMYYRNDGSFVAPDEVYDTLMRIGFDAFDMANNHALDMGAGGLQWSLDYLNKREGLLHFGAYYDEADRANIRTAKINGITVAFLAYTYGTNVSTEVAAQEQGFRFLIPYIDDDKMIEELHRANEIADFTVVYVHWGDEYSFEPNAQQRHAAKILAENGAGVIIGHHTHTIQPIEYLDDGRGGKVLCAYSLGTLVSNMDTDRNMLAGLLTFNVNLYDDGSTDLSDVLFTPTVFYYAMNYRSNTLMYLKELTPALAASHGIGNYPKGSDTKNTMTVERMYEYLHNVIADEYLPEEYRRV